MLFIKNMLAACLAISALMIPAAAHAADHQIRSGETLQSVAAATGHTVQQLHAMNEISDPNFIVTGHSLQYISDTEVKLAVYYLQHQQKVMAKSDYRERFGWQLEQLRTGRIQYSVGGDMDHNVFFGNVIMFAQNGQLLVNRSFASFEDLVEMASR